MVEVRALAVEADEPSGEAWVLIEKRNGQYFVRGRQNGNALDASVAPSGVDSPEAAIQAATAWADLLGIALLYVRDERRPTIHIKGGPEVHD
jgi:hypothetical protein